MGDYTGNPYFSCDEPVWDPIAGENGQGCGEIRFITSSKARVQVWVDYNSLTQHKHGQGQVEWVLVVGTLADAEALLPYIR